MELACGIVIGLIGGLTIFILLLLPSSYVFLPVVEKAIANYPFSTTMEVKNGIK